MAQTSTFCSVIPCAKGWLQLRFLDSLPPLSTPPYKIGSYYHQITHPDELDSSNLLVLLSSTQIKGNTKRSIMKTAAAYIRISTNQEKQSNSLELQEQTIREFAKRNGYKITKIFSESATGTDDNRPILKQAIENTLSTNDYLIALRVDRLARSCSAFGKLEPIIDKIRLVQTGNQPVSVMLFGILLAVAKAESEMISIRVKSTMRMLREKGMKLGNPNIANIQHLGVKKLKHDANQYISEFSRLLTDLEKAGYTTSKQICARLNELEIKTRRGKDWNQSNLYRLRVKARRAKHYA